MNKIKHTKSKPRREPEELADAPHRLDEFEPGAETELEGREATIIPVVLAPEELEMLKQIGEGEGVEPGFLIRQWVLEKLYAT